MPEYPGPDGRICTSSVTRRHPMHVTHFVSGGAGRFSDPIFFVFYSLHSPPPSGKGWPDNCPVTKEENKPIMSRFWNTALLSAALLSPMALTPRVLLAADQNAARSYHDKQHNDDHAWNGQEDKAYRIYAKQNHRKSSDFSRLKDDDQQNYWNWRHEHSDALLKIEIK
jgi:hypothetical protein